MGSYKPTHLHPWQEVMIDCEGSSQPPDAHGNKYILTYFCCLCHAVFLEPMKDLTASEVRRAFARCVFRSGTVPWLLRSDRGPEFRSMIMREFVALLGPRHRLGMPWRPTDQSGVERSHQETQKILGILIKDVCAAALSAWTDLLCVVEFVVYNTPGPHGYTPRDIDRRWSLATPLEHDLLPFQVLDFEPISDYASKFFFFGICDDQSESVGTLFEEFSRTRALGEPLSQAVRVSFRTTCGVPRPSGPRGWGADSLEETSYRAADRGRGWQR